MDTYASVSSDAELGVRELASANAKEHLEDLEEEHSGGAMAQLVAASYGVVAALMCAPVMMSFASIIFSDPFFAPYMPSLVKLVLCSAAIHQLCYALGSSMPFAVGQVQDAGLIFLSGMARTVVWDAQKWRALYSRAERHALTAQEVSSQQSQSHASAAYGSGLLTSFASAPSVTRLAAYELDDLTILATALWLLAIATAALGVMLVVVGKLRLASLAQYLPVPVVGGYLAYIGFYCGQAGLAMMAGVELTSLRHWNQLLTTHALLRVAPGFAVALAIKLAGGLAARRRLPRIQRALIVPLVLSLTVALFYAVQLGVLGKTLEDARQDGWVGKIPARLDLSRPHHKGGGAWREVPALRPWTLYFPRSPGAAREILLALARLAPVVLPTWVAMVLVVAFSSSLDVAAIEMELGRPLDYDRELKTVGFGNLLSGALGGFSGSYIFSQTIINMRSKVANRVSGLVVCVAELALVFLCDVPPTSLAPTAAFGGLLLLIALELMDEWLVAARNKFSRAEYGVSLFTFAAIHALGLEAGFTAGLVAAALAFAVTYSHSAHGGVAVQASPTLRSVVMRDFEQRAVLSAATRRGDIFAIELRGYVFFGAAAALLAAMRQLLATVHVEEEEEDASTAGGAKGGAALDGSFRSPRPTNFMRSSSSNTSLDDSAVARSAGAARRSRWVVIDARDFVGVDATSARSCFAPLRTQLLRRGVRLVVACARPEVLQTLRGHGVELTETDAFATLDAALEHCEEAVLRDALCATGPDTTCEEDEDETWLLSDDDEEDSRDPTRALRQILHDYLFARAPSMTKKCRSDYFLGRASASRSQLVTRSDEEGSDAALATLSQSGPALERYFERKRLNAHDALFEAGVRADALFFVARGTVDLTLLAVPPRRIMRVKRGGVCGELNFFLQRASRFTARAATPVDAWMLRRDAADAMRQQHPELFVLLQSALLKSIALQVEDSLLIGAPELRVNDASLQPSPTCTLVRSPSAPTVMAADNAPKSTRSAHRPRSASDSHSQEDR